MRLAILFTGAIALAACSAGARTCSVPVEYATIQNGINAAVAGDTVLVSCGTYLEHELVMKSGVVLRGETGAADCVIIDAQGLGRVMTCTDADANTSLEGLTFTGGADHGNEWGMTGGGLLCVRSPIQIRHCSFVNNVCELGGGGLSLRYDSDATIGDCTFADNIGWYGGGLSAYYSSPTVTRCSILDNWVSPTYGQGGGVACFYGSHASLSFCTITGNIASRGGGVAIGVVSDPSHVTVDHCTIADNEVSTIGGGVSATGEGIQIDESSIRGNTAGEEGGGLHLWGAQMTCFNTDIRGNTGSAGPDVYSYLDSMVQLICCDVDLAGCEGPGEITLDLSVCEGIVAAEPRTWGGVKALYR
jgi:hypothetical protein